MTKEERRQAYADALADGMTPPFTVVDREILPDGTWIRKAVYKLDASDAPSVDGAGDGLVHGRLATSRLVPP